MSAEPAEIELAAIEHDDLEVPDYPGDETDLIERMDWFVNRAAWYRRKIVTAEAQRDRMIARYQDWCERTTASWRRKVDESEAWVTYAHLDAIDANPRHPKVLHLPSGTVRSVTPRASVVVDNAAAFRDWVVGREDAERLSRWKVEPVKDEVRKVLEDGEVVPGVRLEAGERTVRISVEGDE